MYNDEELARKINTEDLEGVIQEFGLHNLEDLEAFRIKNLKYEIKLLPNHWKKFDNFLGIKESDWTKIKYYNEDGEKNEELLQIPNDSGGIYIYYIKPTGIPIDNYYCIMYIGRAHYGEETQNLRKRVNSYDGEAKNLQTGRIKIRQLFNTYRDYLYVMYITVDGNDNIDRLEKELMAAIAPPVNDDLFEGSLKKEQKMF